MKLSGSKKIALFLGYSKLKRSKSNTFIFLSAIVLTITFIQGVTIGTKYLQSTIILEDLNSVITDISIGVSLPENISQPDMNITTESLNQLSYVNSTIVKRFIKDSYRGGDGELIHDFGVDNSALATFNKLSRSDPYILSFDSEEFRSYVELSKIKFQKQNKTLLTQNTTIISSYLAYKMNVTINDTLYIHYINWYSGTITSDFISNNSFPLKITNILSILSESQEAKDLVRNPFFDDTEGINRELLIINSETFLKILNSLMGDFRGIVMKQLSVSLFLNREQIIDSYNTVKSPKMLESIEKEVINKLQTILPQGSVFYTQNLLLEELKMLENDISKLQQTLTMISIPIISFVLGITLISHKISMNDQIHQYGVWICRGLSKNEMRTIFLVEGTIVGFFAALGGILSSLSIIFSFYFVIPNDGSILQWFYPIFSNLSSIVVNSLFLGISLGLSLNYITSRKVMKIQPILTLQKYQSGMTSWFIENRRTLRLIIFLMVIIGSFWIFLQTISIIGFLGMFQELFQLFEDIFSILPLLLPILIVLLLVQIITNRRDIIVKYMGFLSFPLNPNIQEIICLNYLRRPKHFSNLAFLVAIAFSMGITPIILSQSAHDVSIRQIKREVGADIRITSTYEQMKAVTPSTLYNLSSSIIAVTPMIWVDSHIIVANYSHKRDNQSATFIAYYPTGVLAIQPEKFPEVAYFEDNFTPNRESNELFSQLSSDIATAIAPIGFKNYEIDQGEYVEHDIGSVLSTQFNFINEERLFVNFNIVGFFYLIPGFIQSNFNPPKPLICSIDYLASLNVTQRFFSPSSKVPMMSWLVKIDSRATDNERESVFNIINDCFYNSEVFFLDNEVRSFLATPTGSITRIMDTMFFLVILLTLFGLGIVFFQTFRERKKEVSIYRSRGMTLTEIRTMLLFEVLSIDVLGAIFGITIGVVTSLTYIDVLINPYPVIPVYMLVPGLKIILYMGILSITHICIIFGLSYWIAHHSILANLRIRD